MLHIKDIKPRYTQVLTTGDKYEEDMKSGGVIVAYKDSLKLYQKVIAVGNMVKDIEPGDTVMLDYSAYEVKRYDKNSIQNDLDNNKTIRLDLPWVTMDDEEGNPQSYLLMDDRDIKFKCSVEEINENIIVPDKPKLILDN
jgi:pyruvate kinase